MWPRRNSNQSWFRQAGGRPAVRNGIPTCRGLTDPKLFSRHVCRLRGHAPGHSVVRRRRDWGRGGEREPRPHRRIASRSEEAPNTQPYRGRSETQTATLLPCGSVDRRVVSTLLVDLINYCWSTSLVARGRPGGRVET